MAREKEIENMVQKSKIRDTEIKLSDLAKNELTYYYGSYNNFRKSNFGKLKLSNNGIDVDTLYQELCNDYPEFFEDGIAEQDKIIRISEVYDSLKPVYQNEYGGNIDDVAMMLALQMHDDYSNVPEVKTFADKKQEQYTDMQNKYKGKIKELKADMKEKHDNEIQRLKDKNKELRLDKNKKILEQRAMFQEKIVKTKSHAKERKGIEYYRPRVEKNIKKLSKWLFNGDDSHNVPEKFRKSIAVALQMVDTSSIEDTTTKRSIDFAELVAACNLLVEDEIDVDPDLITEVLEFKEISQGKKMLDMSASELKQLNEIIKRIMKTCVNANKLLANERYENVSAMAYEMYEDFSKRKTVKAKTQTVEKINNLVTYDSMDTVRYFDRIGGEVGNTLWRELRNGLDKKIVNTKTTEEYVKNNKGNLNISKLTGTNAKVHEFNLENGSSIKLTTAQIMGLYELNKREQAREHIYGSGILQGVTVTGKVNKKVTKSYEAVKVTPQDVQDMISKLSDKEVEFADKLAEFMNTTAAEWGNDVSLQMYGYKKFTEQNYYPIKCDENSTNSDVSDNKNPLFTLKNLGFTKQTKRHANNPVVIEDIFDVFTQHTNNMATYNAFAVPLTDLTKFYNFKSRDEEGMIQSTVKQELERVLGKDGKVYYYNLLKSINQTAQDHIGEQLSRKMLANFKAAAIGANIRVAVQQPISIIRAFNMLNPTDFAKMHFTRNLGDIMEKYAPIATWKNYGFFELDTSRQIKDILLDKHTFRDASMWLIGKGDDIAWKIMWNACENEVTRTTNLKRGTEEFYKKVGERFSDVIDRTQVVDSVLHRTQITRSDNLFVKALTSFMAEPLKTYNILLESSYDVVNRPSAKSNAKFVKATICFVTNAVLVSACASLISAIRDDDEDKTYLEKYLNVMFGIDKDETDLVQRIKNMFFSEVGSNINPLNMIPFVKDILNVLEGWDVKRIDMEGFTQIVRASTQWINKMSDSNYKYSDMYIIKNAIKGLSTFTGVPLYSVYRTIENSFRVCVECADSMGVDVSEMKYTLSKSKYEIASTKNKSYYGKKILKSKLEGNDELAKKIADEMAESGMSKDKLKQAYESAKESYLDSNEIIIKAAENRLNGETNAYAEAVVELKGDVFSQDEIIRAINRAIGKSKKGEDITDIEYYDVDDLFEVTQENNEKLYKSTYSYKELNKAIEDNDYQDVLDDMLQAYKDNGSSDSDAKSSVRSQVTKYFKPIYIDSNSYERSELIDKLCETGLYGSYEDAREDIEKWDKKQKLNPYEWID